MGRRAEGGQGEGCLMMLWVLCVAHQTPAGSMPGWHPATVPRSRGGTQTFLFQPQTSRQHPCFNVGTAEDMHIETACTACGVSTPRGSSAPSPPAHARCQPGPLQLLHGPEELLPLHTPARACRHLGLHIWPSCVQPLASHGRLSPITAAATGRSGRSWPEPRWR